MRLPFRTIDLEKFILENIESLGLNTSNPWVEISQHMGAYLSVSLGPIDRGPETYDLNDWDYQDKKEEYRYKNTEKLLTLEKIIGSFLGSNNFESSTKELNISYEERGDINAELYFEIAPGKGKK